MSIAADIASRIASFPEDTTFGYSELKIPKESYATAAKALERLQEKRIIKKISKGIFYKPKNTVFGELQPSEETLLKDYLFENGKRIAYLTGTYLYNQMGLTTQVPNVWKIASFNKRIFVQRGNLKATPIKAYTEITNENYRLLVFLDALKDWRTIPDLNPKEGISILSKLLKGFSIKEIKELIRITQLYPPRVIAFLGALLQASEIKVATCSLKDKLNPLTTYQLNLDEIILPTAPNWHIT